MEATFTGLLGQQLTMSRSHKEESGDNPCKAVFHTVLLRACSKEHEPFGRFDCAAVRERQKERSFGRLGIPLEE